DKINYSNYLCKVKICNELEKEKIKDNIKFRREYDRLFFMLADYITEIDFLLNKRSTAVTIAEIIEYIVISKEIQNEYDRYVKDYEINVNMSIDNNYMMLILEEKIGVAYCFLQSYEEFIRNHETN